MEPAVSGKYGHKTTLRAACVLVQGFDLTVGEAWPLMCAFNKRCKPPWSGRDLRRKLDEADKQPGQRGHLRLAASDHSDLKRCLELGPSLEEDGWEVTCEKETCPLHGAGVRHRHYDTNCGVFGLLEKFADNKDAQNPRAFLLYDESKKDLKKALRSKGSLVKAYWPALLFGRSPRVGWTHRQQRLVCGIVYELTRARRRASAQDGRGQVYRRCASVSSSKGTEIVKCTVLDPDREYVAFAGNGRLRGKGYQIVGRTFKGWCRRAGCSDTPPPGGEDRLQMIDQFINDLAILARDLGLIAAAYHRQLREWKDLPKLLDCLRTGYGHDWLEECTLRIYTEADWLVRWRHFFSQKLGFRWIPSSPEDMGPGYEPAADLGSDTIHSGVQVAALLKEAGMSQGDLADAIGCSRKTVNRHVRGHYHSVEFFEKVNELRASMGHPNSP